MIDLLEAIEMEVETVLDPLPLPLEVVPDPLVDLETEVTTEDGKSYACNAMIGADDRPAEEGNRGDNLHVSGLARSVNQQQLDEIFNKHGKVVFHLMR